MTPIMLNNLSTVAFEQGRLMRIDTIFVIWRKRGESPSLKSATGDQNWSIGVDELMLRLVWWRRWQSDSMPVISIPSPGPDRYWWAISVKVHISELWRMLRGSIADTFWRSLKLSGRRAWIWSAISKRKSARCILYAGSSALGSKTSQLSSNS